MKVKYFKKGENVPCDVMEINNTDCKNLVFKFGVDCKVFFIFNAILIFPNKSLRKDECLLVAKNCIFKDNNKKVYVSTKTVVETSKYYLTLKRRI